MKRLVVCALLTSALVAPLAAQAPAGWKLRIDRSTSAADPDGAGEVQFTTIANGFKAVNPAAAIYWHPNNAASGTYTLKGSFKLLEPSGHVNFYGLFIGGRVLEGTEQNYTYFMVAQDGSYLVRKRMGDRMPDPNAAPAAGRGGRGRGPQAITEDVARGQHATVRKPGTDGTSVNDLEVRVLANTVDFAINGTVVHSAPKASINTDGLHGIRVNHLLNVEITNVGLTR